MQYAANLYTGSLFKAGLKWALSVAAPEDIRILSAKYGFIKLGRVIEPYDVRMGDKGQVSDEELKLTAATEGVLIAREVRVLGGLDYFERVVSCGVTHAQRVMPSGLGLIKQIQWLTRNVGKTA